jgi:acyl-coenzyme A synthetase/AMP-(fatty) acid ligase/REP element-mobilizing transposase RayT
MHDTNLLEDQPIAWTPTPDVIERAQLTRFMRQVGVSTWDELYAFSIRDVEKFTEEVLKFLDIKFDPPYDKLLDVSDGIEFPRWFTRSADTPVRTVDASSSEKSVTSVRDNGSNDFDVSAASGGADKSVRVPTAGLNITEMCLDRWQTGDMKDQPAVIWEGEESGAKQLTFGELLASVDVCVETLTRNDVGFGDAVGIHLPMIPETVAALLAINRIGAIAVPVFSGYGIDAVASRMNAVRAKAIFTCDGFPRRGKAFDMLSVAVEAVAKSESIKTVIVIEREGYHVPREGKLITDPTEAKEFTDAVLAKLDRFRQLFPNQSVELWGVDRDLFAFHCDDSIPVKTSAEDPLIILYTSGTTGKPKGIAHTHASFPIKAAQDMAFGTDVGRGTRICWYTDIGWMMGPWLIYGALINGATICIYDGAPDYPTPDRMWEFCAKHKVEVLGISPTLVRALAAHEERSADTPVRTSDASSLEKSETRERRGWYRHKLPHFDGRVTQFITFRLADSLPKSVLEELKLHLEHDKDTDFSHEYREHIEDYLDAGAGDCMLRDPAVARIVQETILYEHGKSCDVDAWVIMPNHAHLLLSVREGYDLAGVMKRIKGISARRINRLLNHEGTVWQADYFDRYIRDDDDFTRKLAYIEDNPVKAELVKEAGLWEFSSAKIDDFSTASGGADKSVRAPFERHDLSSLRAFGSTGEPWNPAPWWWLFEKVGKSKLPIINYSGGTEIAGGILCGNPLLPIKPCSFPAPCPGMDVDILDEKGEPVGPNQVGELVIKQPWIGMARGFWQEKERYLDTYWRRFKDIWVHGDWAMRDEDGHWFILGRSDDTLKVAGKRVGPAEVESLLVAHPLVTEAAVIGVPDEAKGTAMVAFVVLSEPPVVTGGFDTAEKNPPDTSGGSDKTLETELKALVSRDMGKPLAPSKIHFVYALPKTRNAKVMRRVIRAAYLGEDPGDLSALENPQSVDEINSLSAKTT